jgi:hypothetical protein
VCWKPCSSCWSFHLLREEFLSAPIHSPLFGSPYRSFKECETSNPYLIGGENDVKDPHAEAWKLWKAREASGRKPGLRAGQARLASPPHIGVGSAPPSTYHPLKLFIAATQRVTDQFIRQLSPRSREARGTPFPGGGLC